jgi:two-component system sensor histidine kinase MtrB
VSFPVLKPKRLLRWLRRSLRVRVTVMTALLAGGLIAILAVLLSAQVRDGLFNQRLAAVLEDAAWSTRATQTFFNSSDTDSPLAAGALAQSAVTSLLQSGTSADAVLLAWGPTTAQTLSPINPITTDAQLRAAVSSQVIDQASLLQGQVWQSVVLPGQINRPGLVVAAPVTILATEYILAFTYDLSAEARTLVLIERILLAGGLGVALVLVLVTWLVTHQAAQPLASAAAVAKRLAAGDFSERMAERGEDEMAVLARSFNEMARSLQAQIERMEELSRAQRRFVADVSHELRTPLATIKMAGEMVYQARDDFPAEVARSAELLNTQIERFDSLLADLLEISRFDAQAAALVAERADLVTVVEGVLAELTPLATRKAVQLRRHFPDHSASGEIDLRRVERVVRNLVVNAIEHAEGLPVDITIGQSADSLAVMVRDHGLGLSENDVEHVFDRFWRADPARARTTGGTGLGLAIAREDARLHGGTLEAWGAPGQGAAFRLLLPRQAGLPVRDAVLALGSQSGESDAVD